MKVITSGGLSIMSRFMFPGLSLRRGRPEDLPSITRLSVDINYLNGGDYLPGMWLRMVSDHKWHTYVAVKDGEVVATGCYHIVRGGTQACGVGAKTHPSVRAGGLFKVLKEFTIASISAENPQLKTTVGTSAHIDYAFAQKGQEFWNFEDACRTHQMWMKVPVERILHAIATLQQQQQQQEQQVPPQTPIRSLSEDEFKAVLRDDELRRKLFPRNYFNIGPEAYEAHEEVTDVVYGSFREVWLGGSGSGSGEERLSLSIVCVFPCPAGTGVHIDVFGTADVGEILRHILRALLQVPGAHREHGGGEGEVFVMLGVPIETDVEQLRDVLWNDLGLKRPDNKVQELMVQVFQLPSYGSKL